MKDLNAYVVGISEFPVSGKYSNRHTDELCTRCGALPGHLCFEIDVAGVYMKAYPVNSHVLMRELPVEHQAKSSGALKTFG